MQKATERFSDRVSNYHNYRPSYPLKLVEVLIEECGLNANSVIADIGSGTGKLPELLLAKNLRVTGVEPNNEMRDAAQSLFASHSGFTSVAGQAEATGLENKSVDLITVAQAFHWFDSEAAKVEFERILKSEGYIALIWNQRDTDHAFQREYDEMLMQFAPEYSTASHRNQKDSNIAAFYQPRAMKKFSFAYQQEFNLSAFLGRMNSASYTPQDGTPESEMLLTAAQELFNKHKQSDLVEFTYQTTLYLSQ